MRLPRAKTRTNADALIIVYCKNFTPRSSPLGKGGLGLINRPPLERGDLRGVHAGFATLLIAFVLVRSIVRLQLKFG